MRNTDQSNDPFTRLANNPLGVLAFRTVMACLVAALVLIGTRFAEQVDKLTQGFDKMNGSVAQLLERSDQQGQRLTRAENLIDGLRVEVRR